MIDRLLLFSYKVRLLVLGMTGMRFFIDHLLLLFSVEAKEVVAVIVMRRMRLLLALNVTLLLRRRMVVM